MLSPDSLECFSNAVCRKGFVKNFWGFVDVTVKAVCYPGTNQRVLHNGHKPVHSVKYYTNCQMDFVLISVVLLKVKKHDAYMLYESEL